MAGVKERAAFFGDLVQPGQQLPFAIPKRNKEAQPVVDHQPQEQVDQLAKKEDIKVEKEDNKGETSQVALPFEVLQTETPSPSTYDVDNIQFLDIKTVKATYNVSPGSTTSIKGTIPNYDDSTVTAGTASSTDEAEYQEALDRIHTGLSESPAIVIEDVSFDIGSPRAIFTDLVQIGKGSFANVFKAVDSRDGTQVALKIIPKTEADTRSLKKEISILKDCKCEEIVSLKGCYEHEDQYWIVQEFCEAGSLADLQKFHPTFSEAEIAVILKNVLKAVAILHGRKKIHRDIKAANILINGKGQCKLADFGVSAQVNATNGFRGTTTGTPYWMAPEVLRAEPYNNKADIWSLGITCIELATGGTPYSDLHPMQAMFKIVKGEIPALPQGISAQFQDFISKCLVGKAEDRATIEELLKHPFILQEVNPTILTKLVEANLEKIIFEQKSRPIETVSTMTKTQDDGKKSWELDLIDSGTATSVELDQKINYNRDQESLEELGTKDEETMDDTPPYEGETPSGSYEQPPMQIEIVPPTEKTQFELELDQFVTPGDPDILFIDRVPIGEGAFGQVFKARDTRDNKSVALKGIEEHSANTRQLLKEITIMQECKCDNIVSYKGCFRKNNLFYIAMEFCEVGSVFDLMLNCEQTLTELQVAAVMKSCLKGLVFLHQKKKIHRDVKSGNILLNKDGECKLADFGVSAQLNSTYSLRGTTTGTPYWMAPEVLTKNPYSHKADVWSLGIAAIEMATADVPHSSVPPLQAMAIIPSQPAPSLPRGRWSKNFHSFIEACCVKDYDARPTAEALLQHPFVKDVKEVDVLKALVQACLPRIEAARERERRERALIEEMKRRGQDQDQDQDQNGGAMISQEEDHPDKKDNGSGGVDMKSFGEGGCEEGEEGGIPFLEQKLLFKGVRTTLAFQLAGYRTTLQYQDTKQREERKKESDPSPPVPMPTDFGSFIAQPSTGTSTDLDKYLANLELNINSQLKLPQIETLRREFKSEADQERPDLGSELGASELLEKITRELRERLPYDEQTSRSAPELTNTSSGDLDMLEAIRRRLLTA